MAQIPATGQSEKTLMLRLYDMRREAAAGARGRHAAWFVENNFHPEFAGRS